MPMGMAPPPGGPPPMQGGGVNQMAAQDMAGRMGPQGPGGGDVAGQLQSLLQQAVMLTVQAGPEAAVMQGLGEIWKGAFGVLGQKMGAGGGGPQGPGAPGAGQMMPPPGPQMSGPMG